MTKPTSAPSPSLAKLGLSTWASLALHLPLRYEDETRLVPLQALRPGRTALVQGRVVDVQERRSPRPMFEVVLAPIEVDEFADEPDADLLADSESEAFGDDFDSGMVGFRLRFLHFYPSHRQHLRIGTLVRAFGDVRPARGGYEMVHPRFKVITAADAPLATQLTPIYPSTAGVGQALLRRQIQRALELADLRDTLPATALTSLAQGGLPDFRAALTEVHTPSSLQNTDSSLGSLEPPFDTPAWRRVVLDELVAQQIALRRARSLRQTQSAPVLRDTAGLIDVFLQHMPFALTAAQARCFGEISSDLQGTRPMQRLLQGDVGSGKTVVAALAAVQAASAGWQTALMVPTEILAEQHWAKLQAWLAPLKLDVVLLSGRQGRKERRLALERLASGQAMVAVGTHALIQQGVVFQRLGLAIIDEQHRFGVVQRLALRQQVQGQAALAPDSAWVPHQLAMSATPIPRTLAMSYLADLDVSVIDALPPGRSPIKTRVVAGDRREEMLERVRAYVEHGGQVYWVCPAIEIDGDEEPTPSDDDPEGLRLTSPSGNSDRTAGLEAKELQAVTQAYEDLCQILSLSQVGILHGRLTGAEKTETMRRFVAGEVGVLVATTVIEVGVDVPNASLIVIEQAEQFGLAQLHQLRGRVGRGQRESTCVLMYKGPLSREGRERLRVLYETQDGFEVARRDLEIRGPGEFLGARQSGVPMLRYADLSRHADLIEAARSLAQDMEADGSAEQQELTQLHWQRWYGGRTQLLQV